MNPPDNPVPRARRVTDDCRHIRDLADQVALAYGIVTTAPTAPARRGDNQRTRHRAGGHVADPTGQAAVVHDQQLDEIATAVHNAKEWMRHARQLERRIVEAWLPGHEPPRPDTDCTRCGKQPKARGDLCWNCDREHREERRAIDAR